MISTRDSSFEPKKMVLNLSESEDQEKIVIKRLIVVESFDDI